VSAPPRDVRGRLGLFTVLGVLLFVVLSVRLFWVQILRGNDYRESAQNQHFERVRVAPHRGRILDRHGKELAFTAENPTIVVDAAKLDPAARPALARRLAPILGIPAADIVRKLDTRRRDVRLNPGATEVVMDSLRNLPRSVTVQLQPKRIYPYGKAAAHVTGFVGVDQEGIEGLEVAWDRELRGRPGWATYLRDGHQNRMSQGIERAAESGLDLELTIDAELQEVVAERLDAAVAACRAKAGYVLVIEPATGDILAMANSPSYDPIEYRKAAPEHLRNRILSDVIEPGSTIKAMTVSAALEDGSYRPNTPIDCHMGSWRLGVRTISDHEPFGILPLVETFAHSSNIAMAQVGLRLGKDKMYHYLRKFGFAERTGLGLPGEAPGKLKKPENWYGDTAASVAFGYEILVTPLQMAMAYSVLANDGVLMKPRLVRAVRSGDEVVTTIPVQPVRQAVSAKTATTLLEFMEHTVLEGTGKKAGIDWCRVGGKTGTARKYDAELKTYIARHYASFVGVAPANDPRLLIYAVIDEPRGDIYGGSTAAPLFREIIEASWRLEHPIIRPDVDVVAAAMPAPGLATPAGRGRLSMAATVDLETARAETSRRAALASAASDTTDSLAAPPRILGTTPDLRRRSVRQALREAGAAGFAAEIVGTGVVVGQFPAPGEPITEGSARRIILYLGDSAELAERERDEDS
jgi:cell division protein FtsI (penicillin-binding protein 3)